MIPQALSSYEIHETCQIENLGWVLEQLPAPFGKFDPNRKGRIVEVGAFDGVTYSNHWGLIKAGWEALLIEPMPVNLALCRKEHVNRPWVTIEPVACGAAAGELEMFFEREGSRIAALGQERVKVPVATLDSILRKHDWKPEFDLFVEDTEDYELEVLAGFDLEYWKPLLAIVETHGPLRPAIHERFDKLYRIYSEDGLNTLFVRRGWA